MSAHPVILVAEDDFSDQVLLRRAFEKAHLDVHPEFVSDGVEAVEFLEEANHEPHLALLLLDLRMPRMDGFQVLEWLQQHPDRRPNHVVVLSSCYADSDLSRSSRLGVEHYLVKQGDPAELAATLKRLEPYWSEPPSVSSPATHHGELDPRFASAI